MEAAAVAERAAGLVAQEPACVQAVETVAGQRMHAVYPGVPAPARVLVADAVVAAFDIVVDRPRAPRQAIAEVIGAVVVPVAAARGDRKSTPLNSNHQCASRMPSSAFKKQLPAKPQ